MPARTRFKIVGEDGLETRRPRTRFDSAQPRPGKGALEGEEKMHNLPASRMGVVLLLITAPALGQVVDHADVDGVTSLPQSTMDAIGGQKWFFSHASVGGNMMNGMTDLHSADPNRYQLTRSTVSYNSGQQRAVDPPDPTTDGTVYDCSRGNPGWQSKFTIFENSVNVSGWRAPAVDAAMDKLCYIDQNADPNVYIAMMTTLEAAYPSTVFVYATLPLKTGEDFNNVKRNDYNDAVRAHCIANDRLLFDIADMEAHDPNGTEYTFEYGGQTYQKLYSGYTSDGGHLNTPGRQRIAMGWYAVAAVIAGAEPTCALTLTVAHAPDDAVELDPAPADPNAPTYPLNEEVTLSVSPTADKEFQHWEIYDPNHPGDANYAAIDSNTSIRIVMMADREVTAVFNCGCVVTPMFAATLGMMACLAAVRRRR